MASTVARSFSDEERTKRFLPRELRNYSWPMSWLISRAEMDRKRGGGKEEEGRLFSFVNWPMIASLFTFRRYLSVYSLASLETVCGRDYGRAWLFFLTGMNFVLFSSFFSVLKCSRILMRKDRTLVGKVKLMVKPIPSLPDH